MQSHNAQHKLNYICRCQLDSHWFQLGIATVFQDELKRTIKFDQHRHV